ncbi:MAG: dihydroorotase [Methanobacteriaceae archaeon]|jgi:dihydroorotase|nr:dihydroorotase [Candidatus Methanorudis spinitermitis]
MNELVLKNCKFVDSQKEYYIGMADGKIAEISKQPLKSDDKIDVNGKIVLPGLIDPHVHFRDPGLTYKEDFKSGSLAAANGGFTTVIDMPNTIPKTNTEKAFKKKIKIGESKSVIDFSLHSGFNNVGEMKKIAKHYPSSFKIFMDLKNDINLEKIFENISLIEQEYLDFQRTSKLKQVKWKPMITAHCENKFIIHKNIEILKKNIGVRRNQAIIYSDTRPSEAENVSVKQAIDLAKKYKVKLHICHLSSKDSLDIVNNEKSFIYQFNKKEQINNPNEKQEMELSFEVTPHHLFLNSNAFNEYGTIAKTNPPLRHIGENLRITNDLKHIHMIGTDHAPHTLKEKQKGVWDSLPGIPNLETTLPLFLTQVNRGNISLDTIVKIFSKNPSKLFNLKNKGSIEIGKDADLIIIDLKKEGNFNLDDFYTKANYSPFENWSYNGIATMTIANGKVIMKDGDLIDKNKGKYIPYIN